ncbi:MAG: hypothetical protein ACREO5_05800, partial [Candidatus Binatia bacterium]
LALTAIGIMWMMVSPGRSESVRIHDTYDDTSDRDLGSHAMDKLKGTAETIKAKATAARGKLMNSKDTMIETVSDASSSAAGVAEDQVQRARQGFNTLLEEQPLIFCRQPNKRIGYSARYATTPFRRCKELPATPTTRFVKLYDRSARG